MEIQHQVMRLSLLAFHLFPSLVKKSEGLFSIITKALVVFNGSDSNLFIDLGINIDRPLLSDHYRHGYTSTCVTVILSPWSHNAASCLVFEETWPLLEL